MSQAVHAEPVESRENTWGGRLKATWATSLPGLVWAQFFGSDLESGYTFLYTWLANQFGHFMIGFAGGLAFVWIFSIWHPSALHPQTPEAVFLVARILSIWFILWILKETLFDVASGHERLRNVKERLRPYREEHGLAAAAGDETEDNFLRDLGHDSRMDVWFYLAGVITAFMALTGPWWSNVISWGGECAKSGTPCFGGFLPFLTFLMLLIASGFISQTWLRRNIAFDRAQLPFVRRFALTDRPVDPRARQEAIGFALNKSENPNNKTEEGPDRSRREKPNHLLIIGPPKSGRTATAVALGTEALLDGTRPPANIVRYITLCKMLDRLVAKERGDVIEEDEFAFPPADAELLIIDDVGAETPSSEPLLSASEFGSVVQRVLKGRKELKEIVKGKRVIWVVGDTPNHKKAWIEALESAFEANCCVSPPIVLREVIKNPERSSQHAKEATCGYGPAFYSGTLWKVICAFVVLVFIWYLLGVAQPTIVGLIRSIFA